MFAIYINGAQRDCIRPSDTEYCFRQTVSDQWWRKLPTESNRRGRSGSEQRASGKKCGTLRRLQLSSSREKVMRWGVARLSRSGQRSSRNSLAGTGKWGGSEVLKGPGWEQGWEQRSKTGRSASIGLTRCGAKESPTLIPVSTRQQGGWACP